MIPNPEHPNTTKILICSIFVDIFDIVLIGNHLGEDSMLSSPEIIHSLPITSLPILREIQSELRLKLALSESDRGFLTTQNIVDYLIASLENQNPNTVLYQNYPNPFNPETWIPFQLADPQEVSITIYDLKGRKVRILDLGHKKAGYYLNRGNAAHWDGRSDWGELIASGIYFYRIKAGNFSGQNQLVILK